jgi:hypothetical protein
MWKGQPIVFATAGLASKALEVSDCGASEIGPAPTELYAVYDITDVIYTLCEKDEEEGNEVLDFINVLLDFVNCTEEEMPALYRSALEKLADHLTFNRKFVEFFASEELDRKTVCDAIYWTLGMVVYRMKIVT